MTLFRSFVCSIAVAINIILSVGATGRLVDSRNTSSNERRVLTNNDEELSLLGCGNILFYQLTSQWDACRANCRTRFVNHGEGDVAARVCNTFCIQIKTAGICEGCLEPAQGQHYAYPTPTPSAEPSRYPSTEPLETTWGTFQRLEIVPHDTSAFTQGLCLTEDGTLYEGTGRWGQSEARIVDLMTGNTLRRHRLDDEYFGEGLTYYRDAVTGAGRIIQITWKARTGFVYDSETLEELERFSFQTTNGEGWGITHEQGSDEFLVSDGTEYLHTWDMITRQERGKVAVRMLYGGDTVALNRINELEWDPFTDTVLANVWYQDVIVRIEPTTGLVLTVYDLASIFTNRPLGTNVLNGIAVTEVPGEVWVTGKLWPNMFRIRLVDP